jgi:hypothetical protein
MVFMSASQTAFFEPFISKLTVQVIFVIVIEFMRTYCGRLSTVCQEKERTDNYFIAARKA